MLNNSRSTIVCFKKRVHQATAARPPTLMIIAKVTVRTRMIDLNVLLGGGCVGIGVDVDGSALNFPMD